MSVKRGSKSQRDAIRHRLMCINEPCAICHKPIDWSLGWVVDPRTGKRTRHMMSGEYDHKVSLAMGGDNSWENAQAVHRACNLKKGAGMRRTAPQKSTDGLPNSRRW